MHVTVQITGASEIKAKLARLGRGLFQLDNGMRQIGEYMANYFANEGFASQGQVFNNTWPRLNLQYAQWKAVHFSGRPILERTGQMRRSFAYKSGSNSVTIGNNQPYFKFHELGGTRLPQRQMMGINEPNKRMIAHILQNEIRNKIEAA